MPGIGGVERRRRRGVLQCRLQCAVEVDVAGLVVRRVRVGDVGRDQLLPLRAQIQGGLVQAEIIIEFADHGSPFVVYFKALEDDRHDQLRQTGIAAAFQRVPFRLVGQVQPLEYESARGDGAHGGHFAVHAGHALPHRGRTPDVAVEQHRYFQPLRVDRQMALLTAMDLERWRGLGDHVQQLPGRSRAGYCKLQVAAALGLHGDAGNAAAGAVDPDAAGKLVGIGGGRARHRDLLGHPGRADAVQDAYPWHGHMTDAQHAVQLLLPFQGHGQPLVLLPGVLARGDEGGMEGFCRGAARAQSPYLAAPVRLQQIVDTVLLAPIQAACIGFAFCLGRAKGGITKGSFIKLSAQLVWQIEISHAPLLKG